MIDEERQAHFIAVATAVLAGLAAKVDHPPVNPSFTNAELQDWTIELLAQVNARMTRALAPWPHPMNGTVDGITVEVYRDMVGDLTAALTQHADVAAGRPVKACAICGDRSHVADSCNRNPLYLAAFGAEVVLGPSWKCFHCGALYTTLDGAREHFGNSVDDDPACVREQAEILTYRAEQLTTLRTTAPAISDDLARCASALRGVRTWLLRAKS